MKVGPVEFCKRAKAVKGAAAKSRVWWSRCGRYQIRESRMGRVRSFYAQVLVDDTFLQTLPKHAHRFRSKHQAEEACRRHARKEVLRG